MIGHAWAAPSGWVWTDDRGQRVYSDQPPPAAVPDSRILQRPSLRPTPLAPGDDVPPAAAPKPAAPTPTAATPSAAPAEDAKAKQEREAMEKRNAEIRADNCRRARAGLATLQSGRRLVTTDEQGRRVTMTSEMKAAERARLEGVVRENCR